MCLYLQTLVMEPVQRRHGWCHQLRNGFRPQPDLVPAGREDTVCKGDTVGRVYSAAGRRLKSRA